MIVGSIVFGLLMLIQICTMLYNMVLLVKKINTFPSCLLEILSIGIFMILGVEFVSKPKESSRFFQSLFHIPVTGAELLIIFNIIVGIVLGFWIFQACFISLRHSLKKELLEFLAFISLWCVGMGLIIFSLLHPSNKSIVAISAVFCTSISEFLLALWLRVDSKSKSYQYMYYGLWSIIYFLVINYGFG